MALTNVPISGGGLHYAHGGPLGVGRIRVTPEDFVVREHLGFDASGDGEHLLLTVTKRGANTKWVARQLAAAAGARVRDVGFSGLKDRHAVTQQAFTVPARGRTPESWLNFGGEGFVVTQAARQRRKLRRGAHRGNEFSLIVRDLSVAESDLAHLLQHIATQGVPNYFGEQRFGHGDGNLAVAERWLCAGIAPSDRDARSFALSAARSALFNVVLDARVVADTWQRLLPGDVVNLDGTGSVFTAAIDAELERRCATLDIHPTGPLCGAGESRIADAARVIEEAALAPWRSWIDGLAALRVEQQRRPLRVAVQDLRWSYRDGVLELHFRLTKGAFATAVLREIVAYDGSCDPLGE